MQSWRSLSQACALMSFWLSRSNSWPRRLFTCDPSTRNVARVRLGRSNERSRDETAACEAPGSIACKVASSRPPSSSSPLRKCSQPTTACRPLSATRSPACSAQGRSPCPVGHTIRDLSNKDHEITSKRGLLCAYGGLHGGLGLRLLDALCARLADDSARHLTILFMHQQRQRMSRRSTRYDRQGDQRKGSERRVSMRVSMGAAGCRRGGKGD